jgi:hypothetical protein|tara:strand:- start:2072 stop:2272 length:201 start_codon:yes stop_codon:yes gene_type:complete
MPTISGFTTKNPIMPQLQSAGITAVQVPFIATPDFRHTKKLDFAIKDNEGKAITLVKKTKATLNSK